MLLKRRNSGRIVMRSFENMTLFIRSNTVFTVQVYVALLEMSIAHVKKE